MARCYNCMKEYPDQGNECPHCGYVWDKNHDSQYYLPPGTLLAQGRYMIGLQVNAGGFGIVYRAWDKTLDKLIAIKEYFPGGVAARQPEGTRVMVYSEKRMNEYAAGKDRFLEEARKIAKFNSHPNVVDVYDFFEDNNTAYMVMEFMEGLTYKQYIRLIGGSVDPRLALNVSVAVLDALKEVHKENIIHRDINPSNIFICNNGMVKLFDFGAARIETNEMSNILTPCYAPPEQYSTNGKQGPCTDIYAVGATMYYALTGIKPEESTDRVQEDHLKSPHELNPAISESVSNAVMRAMAIKPEIRFQNTDQFRDALLNRKSVLDVKREIKRRQRIRFLQAGAVFAVLAVAGGVSLLHLKSKQAEGTLQDTSLEIWVMADEDDTLESAKERFLAMAADFSKEYPQVQMNVAAYEQKEYKQLLNQAAEDGKLPDAFESTVLEESNQDMLASLERTCELLSDRSSYYYLEDYEELFPEKKQMPLCFQLPVIYTHQNADDVQEAVRPNESDSERKLFETRQIAEFVSDTSHYSSLSEILAGQYRVAFPEKEHMEARFDHLWSVSAECSEDKNKDKAAQWLIYYLLAGAAQEELVLRGGEGLPLNRNACDVFFDIYQGELGELRDMIPEKVTTE